MSMLIISRVLNTHPAPGIVPKCFASMTLPGGWQTSPEGTEVTISGLVNRGVLTTHFPS